MRLVLLSSLFFLHLSTAAFIKGTTTADPNAEPTTAKKKAGIKERLKGKAAQKKKDMVASVAKKRTVSMNITMDVREESLLTGSMLLLGCDKVVSDSVRWYVEGDDITDDIDWRVIVTPMGQLEIYPTTKDDSGTYECAVDGVLRGKLKLKVHTMMEAFRAGTANYFLVSLLFLPLLILGIWVLHDRHLEEHKEGSEKMNDFLLQHVNKKQMKAVVRAENKEMNAESTESESSGRRNARATIAMAMGEDRR